MCHGDEYVLNLMEVKRPPIIILFEDVYAHEARSPCNICVFFIGD